MKLKEFTGNALISRYLRKSATHLVSQPGIGKSSIIVQAAAEISEFLSEKKGEHVPVHVIVSQLATKEPTDLVGYQLPQEAVLEDGTRTQITAGTYPRLLADMKRKGPYGLLLIDEYSKAAIDTLAASSQYILDYSVDGYAIPAGWWVVCASNRASDNAGDNPLPSHITNRLEHIEVEFSPDDLANYMDEQGYGQTPQRFVKFKGSALAELPNPDGSQFCTPRSLCQLYEWHRTYTQLSDPQQYAKNTDYLIVDDTVRESASGRIGAMALDYCAFVAIQARVPSIEEIVSGKAKRGELGTDFSLIYSVGLMIADQLQIEDLDQALPYIDSLPVEISSPVVMSALLKKYAGHAAKSPALRNYMLDNNLDLSELR